MQLAQATTGQTRELQCRIAANHAPAKPNIAPKCPQSKTTSPAFGAAGLMVLPGGFGCMTLSRTRDRAKYFVS